MSSKVKKSEVVAGRSGIPRCAGKQSLIRVTRFGLGDGSALIQLFSQTAVKVSLDRSSSAQEGQGDPCPGVALGAGRFGRAAAKTFHVAVVPGSKYLLWYLLKSISVI